MIADWAAAHNEFFVTDRPRSAVLGRTLESRSLSWRKNPRRSIIMQIAVIELEAAGGLELEVARGLYRWIGFKAVSHSVSDVNIRPTDLRPLHHALASLSSTMGASLSFVQIFEGRSARRPAGQDIAAQPLSRRTSFGGLACHVNELDLYLQQLQDFPSYFSQMIVDGFEAYANANTLYYWQLNCPTWTGMCLHKRRLLSVIFSDTASADTASGVVRPFDTSGHMPKALSNFIDSVVAGSSLLTSIRVGDLPSAQRQDLVPVFKMAVEVVESLSLSIKSLSNAISFPVNIPAEILSEIFEFLMDVDPIVCTKQRKSTGWLVCTRVCTRWRHIALLHKHLWARSFSAIPGQEESFGARAYGVPLSIECTRIEQAEENRGQRFNTLIKYLQRAGDISIKGGTSAVYRVMASGAPPPDLRLLFLEHVDAVALGGVYLPVAKSPLAIESLEFLSLTSTFFPVSSPRLRLLRIDLDLKSVLIFPVTELLAIIETTHALEDLSLRLAGADLAIPSSPRRVMVRLRSLSICANAATAIQLAALLSYNSTCRVNLKLLVSSSVVPLATAIDTISAGFSETASFRFLDVHPALLFGYQSVGLDSGGGYKGAGLVHDCQVVVTLREGMSWHNVGSQLSSSVTSHVETLSLHIPAEELRNVVRWSAIFATFTSVSTLVFNSTVYTASDIFASMMRGDGKECIFPASVTRLVDQSSSLDSVRNAHSYLYYMLSNGEICYRANVHLCWAMSSRKERLEYYGRAFVSHPTPYRWPQRRRRPGDKVSRGPDRRLTRLLSRLDMFRASGRREPIQWYCQEYTMQPRVTKALGKRSSRARPRSDILLCPTIRSYPLIQREMRWSAASRHDTNRETSELSDWLWDNSHVIALIQRETRWSAASRHDTNRETSLRVGRVAASLFVLTSTTYLATVIPSHSLWHLYAPPLASK
ncbi:hypothetical protein OF83DRAFT_1086039 [Amylostereum chailletii]|nr:hypothetical protein OF83DRAFT_1086039 [Amylostereum chailletii]